MPAGLHLRTMKQLPAIVSHLALALWVGSVACVAALVAPSAFRALDVADAARVLAPVFRSVDYLGIVAATGLVLLGPRGWRRNVAALMGAGAAASVFYLAPRVDGRNAYHYAAEAAWTVILIGGIVLLYGAMRSSFQASSSST